MKLKYKKIILLTTMSTMGIGLLTLSVNHDRTLAKESLSTGTKVEAEMLADNTASEISAFKISADTNIDSNADVMMAEVSNAEPTAIPTPTPIPVYELEENAYPEIDQLFKDFYIAKNKHDVDGIKSLINEPEKAQSIEMLQKKTQYIENYLNIKTYAKKADEEGNYIVYVYHEIKFTGIETPAPGLSKFYVVTGEDNKPKIFSGEMDEETKAYYDARNNDEDVKELIEMTNQASDEATEKDEDLLNFWESIKELAKSNEDSETSAE